MRPRAQLMLIPLLITIAALATVTFAYGNEHPDSCQPCHGQSMSVNDAGGQMWSHNIQGDATQIWSNCAKCHSSIDTQVQASPHNDVGCRCHAVLHVGFNVSDNVYGVAFYYLPAEDVGTALGKIAPSTQNFVKKKLEFDETNLTAIAQAYGWTSEGMEIEVGLVNLNKEFITIVADGSVDSQGWQACFNCHFISTNPANVGAYRFVEGRLKIGIPESALEADPHIIGKIEMGSSSGGPQPVQESASISSSVAPLALSAVIGLLGFITTIFTRR